MTHIYTQSFSGESRGSGCESERRRGRAVALRGLRWARVTAAGRARFSVRERRLALAQMRAKRVGGGVAQLNDSPLARFPETARCPRKVSLLWQILRCYGRDSVRRSAAVELRCRGAAGEGAGRVLGA